MYKVCLLMVGALLVAACGGSGDVVPTPGSVTPTAAPCASTAVPKASTHDIEFPRVGGDYTRQLPVEGYVLQAAGSHVDVNIVSLNGGLLGLSQLTVGEGTRGDMHRVDDVVLLQAIPDKTRACALIEGKGWKVEIPVRVGGANP